MTIRPILDPDFIRELIARLTDEQVIEMQKAASKGLDLSKPADQTEWLQNISAWLLQHFSINAENLILRATIRTITES